MYNTVIGVGAALLVGGVALYAGYQLTQDGDDAARTETGGRDPGPAAGRGGVPRGERPLDFADGAAGERVTTAAQDEARREAERLAALGTGGVVGETDGSQDAEPRSVGDDDDDGDAARTGGPRTSGLRGGLGNPAPVGSATDADAPAATASRNTPLTDKPDGVQTVRNTPLVDKPDQRVARLIDKPDDGPSFAEADEAQRFDPCMKADGTPYVGPGTAINPFADGDPCLPRATGQAFEVASLGPYLAPVTASEASVTPRILPFGDLVLPGFVGAPPAGFGGSDYGS